MGEGREGDWECGGCGNRNYAFRSLCNRCKQPRLLVDMKTPSDSKWLPRIGDWICAGCSNNNYASREKCKKCGQSKEEAAMPAVAMTGASLPAFANYFSRVQGLPGFKMNYGIAGNSAFQQSLLPHAGWSFGGVDKYGLQSPLNWPFHGNSSGGFSYANHTDQLLGVPKGWRNGDWMCDCGFHNYSSRSQCKKCNAPLPSGGPSSARCSVIPDIFPTLGTKRSASEEFVGDWENKRLNAGQMNSHFLTNGHQRSYQSFDQLGVSSNDQKSGMYSKYLIGSQATAPSVQIKTQSGQMASTPMLVGKGARHWRDGDWMCSNCNNHNYASRSACNRCKTQKEDAVQPVSVA